LALFNCQLIAYGSLNCLQARHAITKASSGPHFYGFLHYFYTSFFLFVVVAVRVVLVCSCLCL